MNVLFIGPSSFGTSYTRFSGFGERHQVLAIDTDEIFGNYITRTITERLKLRFIPQVYSQRILSEVQSTDLSKIDLVWIDTPYVATRPLLRFLKANKVQVFMYLTDSIRSPGVRSVFHRLDPLSVNLVITSKFTEVSTFQGMGFNVYMISKECRCRIGDL